MPRRKRTADSFDAGTLLPACDYTLASWTHNDEAACRHRQLCEHFGLRPDLPGLREGGPMWVMARLGQRHNLHVYASELAGANLDCLVVSRCALTQRQVAAVVGYHHGDTDASWVLDEPQEPADDLAEDPDSAKDGEWASDSDVFETSETSRGQATTAYESIDAPGQVLHPREGRTYRLVRLLDEGGFGRTFEAEIETGSLPGAESMRLCLKVTDDVESWHREAYFGQVLRRVPRAVQIFDSFAFVPDGGPNLPLYCLVSELAEFGSLTSYFRSHPRGWTETRARREIVALLRLIVLLHKGGAVHRDLTPHNVLVTRGGHLALADFGIALHGRGRGVRGDTMNAYFAPSALVKQTARAQWMPADDVYQIGQILVRLLVGGDKGRFDTQDVMALRCSDALKAVIQRAIGQRRKRWRDAAALLHGLEAEVPVRRRTRVMSLEGLRVVFTGVLSMTRTEAARLARRAGAHVQAKVGGSTDVVVEGKASGQWLARSKGQKLLDADRERERGHGVAIVSERQFLRLVKPTTETTLRRARKKS